MCIFGGLQTSKQKFVVLSVDQKIIYSNNMHVSSKKNVDKENSTMY